MLHPVRDTNEMGQDWDTLVLQLQVHETYPALFRRAFGIAEIAAIDADLTAKALAQYVRTLISGNTRYDQYKAGEIVLTEAEDRGRRIFFDIDDGVPTSECGHCHVEPLFSGLEYFNNGLDESYDPGTLADAGLGLVTGRPGDVGRFRTPSLRNIALTAPYMHDGRFRTLSEVLDHYISGGQHGDNVHPNVRKLDFTEQDKSDLIAFLRTLTEIDAEKHFADL
jgi:cytochrome c peroxidase